MANTIPQWFIDDVLARTDLIEILNSRLRLKKTGSNYSAICPFHQEKTPSFSANADKQFFHCFGCGTSGNAIHFLMYYDRMTFPEAMEYLANHAGLELPQTQSHDQDQSHSLYKLLEQAARFYQYQLKHHQQAVDYLKSRSLTGQTARDYRLGYAPDDWHAMEKHLLSNGFSQQQLRQSGLTNSKNRHSYDRFRDRIMFPIRNQRGKTIGFGGRALHDGEPKYLNSPETPIFHKKYELYGLYEARRLSRQLPWLIVVEGFMDVLALAQHSIPGAVATLGTAVSPQHVQKLLRFHHHIIFCFDGDEAGQQAAWRALETTLPFMREGLTIKFLLLDPQYDPDSYLQQFGADRFKALADNAETLEALFFRKLTEGQELESINGRARLAAKASHYLNNMPKGVYQQLMYEKLSDLIQVSSEQISELIQHHHQNHKQTKQHTQSYTQHSLSRHERTLALLLQNPELAQQLETELKNFQPFDWITQSIHYLLEILQSRPTITTGALLQYWDNEQNYIAKLTSMDLTMPASSRLQELKERLLALKSDAKEVEINRLMDQYQRQGLSEEQKHRLQQLLANKADF